MKTTFLFLMFSLGLLAQDRIYLLNGTLITATVTAASPELITVETTTGTTSLFRENILLIDYSNGLVQQYNKPYVNMVVDDSEKKVLKDIEQDPGAKNQISINTLALMNADVSVFYERMLTHNRLGLGVMGAYNFNIRASVPNAHIQILSNGKKNYDLGTFLNFYLGRLSRETTFYSGLFIKYTSISFSSSTNIPGTGVKFTPEKGYQLATMVTMGSQSLLFDNRFCFKTIVSAGLFNLHGKYKEEYNRRMNENLDPKQLPVNYQTLLKCYIGINIGYNF